MMFTPVTLRFFGHAATLGHVGPFLALGGGRIPITGSQMRDLYGVMVALGEEMGHHETPSEEIRAFGHRLGEIGDRYIDPSLVKDYLLPPAASLTKLHPSHYGRTIYQVMESGAYAFSLEDPEETQRAKEFANLVDRFEARANEFLDPAFTFLQQFFYVDALGENGKARTPPAWLALLDQTPIKIVLDGFDRLEDFYKSMAEVQKTIALVRTIVFERFPLLWREKFSDLPILVGGSIDLDLDGNIIDIDPEEKAALYYAQMKVFAEIFFSSYFELPLLGGEEESSRKLEILQRHFAETLFPEIRRRYTSPFRGERRRLGAQLFSDFRPSLRHFTLQRDGTFHRTILVPRESSLQSSEQVPVPIDELLRALPLSIPSILLSILREVMGERNQMLPKEFLAQSHFEVDEERSLRERAAFSTLRLEQRVRNGGNPSAADLRAKIFSLMKGVNQLERNLVRMTVSLRLLGGGEPKQFWDRFTDALLERIQIDLDSLEAIDSLRQFLEALSSHHFRWVGDNGVYLSQALYELFSGREHPVSREELDAFVATAGERGPNYLPILTEKLKGERNGTNRELEVAQAVRREARAAERQAEWERKGRERLAQAEAERIRAAEVVRAEAKAQEKLRREEEERRVRERAQRRAEQKKKERKEARKAEAKLRDAHYQMLVTRESTLSILIQSMETTLLSLMEQGALDESILDLPQTELMANGTSRVILLSSSLKARMADIRSRFDAARQRLSLSEKEGTKPFVDEADQLLEQVRGDIRFLKSLLKATSSS